MMSGLLKSRTDAGGSLLRQWSLTTLERELSYCGPITVEGNICRRNRPMGSISHPSLAVNYSASVGDRLGWACGRVMIVNHGSILLK